MPELPEVETVIRGLEPYIKGATIEKAIIRCYQLRWPIPENFNYLVAKQKIIDISRRGKYLLIHMLTGTIILHLGMSGRVCLLTKFTPTNLHDHLDILFTNNQVLRYTDPRRFGAILWALNYKEHPLLIRLGVEPLTDEFTADYLLKFAYNRRVAIKPFLMNSKIVAGIGNIYATEALFLANLHPAMPSGRLTKIAATRLVEVIKQVLAQAIMKGGTTLKDFVNSEGRPGYFSQQLKVYGRAGLPCISCKQALQFCMLGQRSTVFCAYCQPLI